MIEETYALWDEDEYEYSNGHFQLPCLFTMIHGDEQKRPAMLVVPGGAYTHLSQKESAPVAEAFFEMGYQAFVLNYTVDETLSLPLGFQPLMDISRAVRLIRSLKDELKLVEDRLYVCGFSAGGHLCANLCVYHEDINDGRYADISPRPDGAVLCYPVITGGRYGHEASFKALLGDYLPLDGVRYFSPERHVKADTPPAFVWSMQADESVPYQNAQLYFEALQKKGVASALHIFHSGRHGIALGGDMKGGELVREVAVWPRLAHYFLEGIRG